jgi:hypothetical protein
MNFSFLYFLLTDLFISILDVKFYISNFIYQTKILLTKFIH